MRNLHYCLLITVFAGFISSCGKDKDTEPGSGGSGGGTNSLVGKWYTESRNIDVTFRSDNTGVLHYTDVNNTPGCEEGSVTMFTWETNDGMLTLDYQSMRVCGESRSPENDPPKPYTVTGNTLEWAGTTWYRDGGSSGSGSGGSGSSGNGNGSAMFWLASDLGCGNITVTCNGVSKAVSGYYSSGAPDCGASYSATFDLKPGTYSFTAACSSLDWDGSITVKAGACSKMQLTGNGSSGGGSSGGGGGNSGGNGGGNGSTTGDVVLWAGGKVTGKNLRVEVYRSNNGNKISYGIRTITANYSSPPACGASGSANYTLEPGVYRYGAQIGEPGTSDYEWWEDGFNIKKGQCIKERIY